MVVGIELNNIIRDFNKQVMKYYIRDINPDFDESTVDPKCVNILDYLPFENKKAKEDFVFIDYPYELFGCAKPTSKHLHTEMYEWIRQMDDVKIILFSTMESALTIQSTYFFLSKGNKTRCMMFPENCEEMWDVCDAIITTNSRIVNSKPEDKKVILVEKSDNKELKEKSDYVYGSFQEIMADKDFTNKLNVDSRKKKHTFKEKIISILKLNKSYGY